jgi:hypothetical protein
MHSQSGFERTNPRHDARLVGKTGPIEPMQADPYNLGLSARIIFWGCVGVAVPLWLALAVWG